MKNVIKIWKFITSHFNGIILLVFLGLFTWAFLCPTYKVSTLILNNINSGNIKDISNSALLTICLAIFQAFVGLLAIGGGIIGFFGFSSIKEHFDSKIKNSLKELLDEKLSSNLGYVTYDHLRAYITENAEHFFKDEMKPKKTTQVENPEEV